MQTQQGQYGIKETLDVGDLVASFVDAVRKSKEGDGKIDLKTDFVNFITPVTIIPRAFEGAREIPKEWGDLDESEIQQLRDRFGEIVFDERWQRAFVGLVTAGDAIYEIATGQ